MGKEKIKIVLFFYTHICSIDKNLKFFKSKKKENYEK
jgi:hypothetical protein